jgi:hypothetical protein
MLKNKNDSFIPELGTRVVALDWYLQRDSQPILEEALEQEKE